MTNPQSLYPSVGNQLLKAGTSGVVAMAYSVYVQTAVRFMARLYQGLINGEDLARAVTLAREELRSHPQHTSPIGNIELRDWVVPVLFEAAPFRMMEHSTAVHLDLSILEDQPTKAGSEIDCPDPPAYGFVGRDGVMLELERAFQSETIVLLQGMAGVGKTEMAMGFARWRVETGGLEGPIFFFKFENYLPLVQVLDRVGQVFNPIIRQQLKQEWHLLNATQRYQVALGILKQIPCLMIWDNFEPVKGFPIGTDSAWTPAEQEELRRFLVDLRGGRTMLLVTSRRDEPWLGKIYRLVELGGLKLTEAQELAIRVLRRAGLDAGQIKALPQYNNLLQYLGGNPLAIQVILPELKRTSPETLLEALQSGAATFGAEDPKQGRDHSLTASLTYRLAALDPTVRKHLGVLALFQGFINASILAMLSQKIEGAPALLSGLGRDDWMRILNTAAEIGLLRCVGEGYYTIHPALPWFFHDLLRESFPNQDEWFEHAFITAYGSYGSYLDDLFCKNAQLAISLLRAEEENLKHALRLGHRYKCWDDLKRILCGLMRLLTTQGRWVEWERLIAEIETVVTDPHGEPLAGREALWRTLLEYRAEILEYRRDFEKAKKIYLSLKTYYENIHNDQSISFVLHQLGMIAQEGRQFDEAEGWYRRSLAIKERFGYEYGQATTLHQLGMIAQERRQFDEAESLYRQSLAIEKRIGDDEGQAQTFCQLGANAMEQRHFNDAESLYRQSLAIAERIGNEYGQSIILHQLGMIAQERQQFDEAEGWYRRSLAIEVRIGNEHEHAKTLHQLGSIAEERQQFVEAEGWYRRSLAIKEQIDAEHEQTKTLHQLGMIALVQRQFDEAEGWYRQSLAIEVRIGNEHGQAITLHQLGMIAQARRQFDEAKGWYRQSLAIEVRIGNEHGQAMTLLLLGIIAEEQGNIQQAILLYEQAEAILTRSNDPQNLEFVWESLKRARGKG